MARKANEDQLLTKGEFLKETRLIHQDLDAVEKKLHMEIIGTQNDLLKFKDEIVLNVIKAKAQTDALGMKTQDLEVRVFSLEKTFTAKMDEMFNRFDAFAQRSEDHDNKVLFHNHRLENLEEKSTDHETRLTRLESK